MNEKYIEVFGEAEYFEEPEIWILDITLKIQTASEETLAAESRDYKNRIVKTLLDEGIEESELFYAGTDSYTPWWKKVKVGLNISHKITIRTKDRYKAYRAMEKLDGFNKVSKRITIQIDERKPIFKASESDVLNARRKACENALEKAKGLVECFGMKVSQPIEIQEIEKLQRASGNYGDFDWGGTYPVAGAAAAPVIGTLNEAIDEIELKGNSRLILLRYRVKFSIF